MNKESFDAFIRRKIAIVAMHGMSVNPEYATSTVEFIAETAVKQADALIKELNKEVK